MAKKKKWIQGAVKRPGALTRKAKRKGMTVSEFCSKLGPRATTRTKRQCAFAKTVRKFHK